MRKLCRKSILSNGRPLCGVLSPAPNPSWEVAWRINHSRRSPVHEALSTKRREDKRSTSRRWRDGHATSGTGIREGPSYRHGAPFGSTATCLGLPERPGRWIMVIRLFPSNTTTVADPTAATRSREIGKGDLSQQAKRPFDTFPHLLRRRSLPFSLGLNLCRSSQHFANFILF
jgi:hypothetical protein